MKEINKLSDIKKELFLAEKKPVIVKVKRLNEDVIIKTLEGNMIGRKGSFIIEGVTGEVYPCREDIFFKTYNFVKEVKE